MKVFIIYPDYGDGVGPAPPEHAASSRERALAWIEDQPRYIRDVYKIEELEIDGTAEERQEADQA